MKTRFLSVLCGIVAPLACFASNEGVPSYYQTNTRSGLNRNAYGKYQQRNNYQQVNNSQPRNYVQYAGNNGARQILSSKTYSYQVPIPQYNSALMVPGAMTPNGVANAVNDNNTTIYAGYSRRFADFEFKTGVNSILEWDDMFFNEIDLGVKHLVDIRGFDVALVGDYTYGDYSSGGLSMDYDLEPYDYAYPADGIFTISMGDQSGHTNRLRLGVGAHHIWDVAGWKLTPYIGYEIFKHNLKMGNHMYPNPGVYLPLMVETGQYVFGDIEENYYAVDQGVSVSDDSGLYQICMSPEDIKVVPATAMGTSLNGFATLTSIDTIDYNSNMGDLPWGVPAGNCVVIGGDGVIMVDGITHIYNTTWSGFYLGLEVEKQMTLTDKLRLYVQVSMPKYSSEGTWPNRDDWQQDPSFLDEGSNGGFAYSAELEYSYQLSDRMAISLKADTNYFHVGKISGELYVAEQTVYIEDEDNPGSYIITTIPAYTEKIDESLSRAVWRSFGLHIGLKYSF